MAFADKIAKHIQNYLDEGKQLREENPRPHGKGGDNPNPEEGSNMASSSIKPVQQCLKQLEEKLDVDWNDDETRFGVVGMVWIGKTYMAECSPGRVISRA